MVWQWVSEDVILCTVDYHLRFSDGRLAARVAALKQFIHREYARQGSPQEEVWVVAHQGSAKIRRTVPDQRDPVFFLSAKGTTQRKSQTRLTDLAGWLMEELPKR